MLPYYSAIFEPSITDFYSWVIPKERFLILGSALSPGKNVYQKFLKLKEQLGNYGYRLGESVNQESTVLVRPGGTRDIQTGAGQALLIGEAAGLISPSSAEGLSYAFVSALLAAKALSGGLHDPAISYHRMTASLRSNIIRKRIKSSIIYFAPTRRAIMASGLLSIKLENS
jgi:flavin-dependent dehydrogenase